MKRKLIAILMVLLLSATLVACGGGKETTLTGMVVSVDGTVVSLMEMDDDSMGQMDFSGGEMPEGMELPEGMEMPEGMEGFGDFNPEDFEGGNFPQQGDGEMPQMPEGMEMPDGMEMPEGMTMPESGEMPDFSGEMNGMMPGFGNFDADVETQDVDIADAHISVEIDGGKASGSMEDIQPGTFVTLTMNGRGKVTNVLVSSQTFFGGGRRPAN